MKGKNMQRFRNTPYFVSEEGNVFREGKPNPLKADIADKGYRRVTLSIKGKTERFLVHRMVAEIYLPKKEEDIEVNHKDNTPGHDWKDNLEWTTKSGNQIHAHRQGRCANLIASKKVSENKFATTEQTFKEKLGEHFIRVVNENPRNFIEFYCATCRKQMKCRTDSSIFNQAVVKCKRCVKMKI